MRQNIHLSSSLPFKILPVVLLFGLLFLIYSNSFTTAWQMDDRPNILNNKALHLENLMPEKIWRTFFSNQGRENPKLFRPVACFTFAINWYVGQDNPIGYHIVNFGFHFATAIALYFLSIKMLSLLYNSLDHRESLKIHNIAILTAVFWAINPIQVQAVTYIVQRMAVMAAFFYVLAILYYIKARTTESQRQQWIYALLCCMWFLCALGSKENAIMVPVSLVLVEWIFFQKGRTDFFRWPITWFVGFGLTIAMITAIFLYTGGTPVDTIRSWYNNRPFSLEERLMTQPRVVMSYLSQIFYPLPDRFSIAHDITLSKSLFYPWTTVPAIVMIITMIISAFSFVKRYPLFSFAVLFFFLNHVIESSVFPLEIIFEHRNYLPSLFLFLPIAAGLNSLLTMLRRNNPLLQGVLAVSVSLLLISVGLSTYSRNEAWATGITLWADAAQKAPNNLRPLVTLGVRLAWRENPSSADYNFAMALFRRALELPEAARKTEKAEILGNIASIYFHRSENEKAIATYLEALELDQSFLKNRSDLLKPLIITGNFEEAMYHTDYLLKKRPVNHDYLAIKGFILLWLDKPDEALPYFQKALAYGPPRPNLMLNTGVALTLVKRSENGRWFLQQAIKRSPGDLLPLLSMIENRARANDHKRASEYARQVIYTFSVPIVYKRVEEANTAFHSAPITPEYITPFIKNELDNIRSNVQ